MNWQWQRGFKRFEDALAAAAANNKPEVTTELGNRIAWWVEDGELHGAVINKSPTWGYRHFTESNGPHYYSVSDELLAKTRITNELWRERRNLRNGKRSNSSNSS